MNLGELRRELVRHGVSLAAMAKGELRPPADVASPRTLGEAMREHHATPLRQVREGRLDVAAFVAWLGHGGRCAR